MDGSGAFAGTAQNTSVYLNVASVWSRHNRKHESENEVQACDYCNRRGEGGGTQEGKKVKKGGKGERKAFQKGRREEIMGNVWRNMGWGRWRNKKEGKGEHAHCQQQ